MTAIWQDLRYGARMLLKSRSFTALAVLSLALGIGANTAIFSLINATLLRQLPVAEPEQLVYVFSGNPGTPYGTTSYPDYVEFRDQNQVFGGLVAYGGITLSLNSNDQTEQVAGWVVSGNYFDVLGVPAALGRTFLPEEDQTPGTHRVAVISHGLWQRRFGGDPGVIGRQMLLNGHSFTIIGVAPANFHGTEPETNREVYVPLMMQAVVRPPRSGYSGEMNPDLLATRGNRWLWMVGRLKPGVTPGQAGAAMNVIAQQQGQAFPNTNRNRIATLTPVSQGDPEQRGSVISVAGLLMSVVGITLLIACANVANLLLARASARGKEIAVRLALGASRFRLMRQLLTESVLLAALGGTVGLLLTWWAIDLLKAVPPPLGVLPIRVDFSLDASVLLFTLLLSLLTGIIFGFAPALQASRPDLVPALKDESFALDQKSRRFSLRNMLVVSQVALSLVLLISAGLFLRSLREAQTVDPGFDAEKILTVPLSINLLRYTSTQGREFYRQVIERVEALPGVESASLARLVALGGGASTRSLLIEGQAAGPDNTFRSEGGGGSNPDGISVNIIGLKYFQTMGIALRHGRDFVALDTEDKPGVVIINEAFAERYFAGQNPLGKRLSFRGTRGPWQEIIGVARDSKYRTLGEASTPFVYQPLAQNHETGVTLHVRAGVDPASLMAAVQSEVQGLEKNLPVTDVRPMTELISASLYAARMGAVLLGIFSLLALLLAGVGLYGVMSFAVAQRTHEIGIRMALGAHAGDVLRLVIREGMTLVAIGLLLGLIAAAAVTRFLASFLYGISTMDATTYASVPVVLAAVALLACYIPARRATRVDPMVALRYE